MPPCVYRVVYTRVYMPPIFPFVGEPSTPRPVPRRAIHPFHFGHTRASHVLHIYQLYVREEASLRALRAPRGALSRFTVGQVSRLLGTSLVCSTLPPPGYMPSQDPFVGSPALSRYRAANFPS